MSERAYFSLRYAIPGYSFILFVIAINYVPLVKILAATRVESAFGAFLAFLSLFTGSAIGFLISQFWWWWLYRHPFFGNKKLKSVVDEICEKFLKTSEEKIAPKRYWEIGRIFEWIIRQGIREKSDEKFYEFCERRWDMYTLLASTKMTLIIAAGVGIICRGYSHFFIPDASFNVGLNAETIGLLFIFIGWGSLLIVLWNSTQRLMGDYSPYIEALVLKSALNSGDLKKVFPDYFQKEEKPRKLQTK